MTDSITTSYLDRKDDETLADLDDQVEQGRLRQAQARAEDVAARPTVGGPPAQGVPICEKSASTKSSPNG